MSDWLNLSWEPTQLSIVTLVTRFVAAWLAGWLVARIARTGRSDSVEGTLPTTLILMSILIAMATQIIGDNVARAFSLVGALSIVRFRTAVPTPREVAFVLASVVVGMAIGAGTWPIAVVGLVVLAMASIAADRHRAVQTELSPSGHASRLTIQTGVAAKWSTECLNPFCQSSRLLSAGTSRSGTSMTFDYAIRLKPECSADQLLMELHRHPEVESVAWTVKEKAA